MDSLNLIIIGYVKQQNNQKVIEILPQYSQGLNSLELISHAFVLWWIHKADLPEFRRVKGTVVPRVRNPKIPPREMGTFATRSPQRPNPIGLTLVKIINIKDNYIYVDSIDAYIGSPIIDIKPYLPNSDRVDNEVKLPEWFSHLLVSRKPDLREKTKTYEK